LPNRKYIRNTTEYGAHTFLGSFQPFIAVIGLVGCLLVFAFGSASWWVTPGTPTKILVAYAAVSLPLFCHMSCLYLLLRPGVIQHIFLAFLLVVLKIANGKLFERWYVRLDSDINTLIDLLDDLNSRRREDRNRNS
jgi:yeast amino acid transporter